MVGESFNSVYIPPVNALLYLPWFRLEAWNIPLPSFLGIDYLPIQPFGVLVAIGVLASSKAIEWYAEKKDFDPMLASEFMTHILVPAFIGAYFLNGLFYETDTLIEVLKSPNLLFKKWLGLSSFGGFIGATIGIIVWRLRRKIPVWYLMDAAAFAFPFGWLFGRTGCFVVHDHPGVQTDFFLAVGDYHFGTPPFVPRHDLGLYEVIWSAAAIAVYMYLFQTKRDRPTGLYVALLPIMYTPIRFFLDFLRANAAEGGDIRFAALTPGQYSAIGFFILGCGLLYWTFNRQIAPIPDQYRLSKMNAPKEAETKPQTGSKKRKKKKKA